MRITYTLAMVGLAGFLWACGGAAVDGEVKRAASMLALEVTETSEVEKYDLSGDGKADVWKYYSYREDTGDRLLARVNRDYNWDGSTDSRQHFNDESMMVKEELDLDFDGVFDAVDYYEGGVQVRREMAFNFQQRPTLWKYYMDGKLVRKERDTNGSGSADTFEYWESGKLVRVGYDRDGDGRPDFYEKVEGATGG